MYLLDTNIWLELLLDQEHAKDVKTVILIELLSEGRRPEIFKARSPR